RHPAYRAADRPPWRTFGDLFQVDLTGHQKPGSFLGRHVGSNVAALRSFPAEAEPPFNIRDVEGHRCPRRGARGTPRRTEVFNPLTGWKSGQPAAHPARMKRTRHNVLKPIDRPTWLVVRDRHHELVSHVELAPGADPAQVLA